MTSSKYGDLRKTGWLASAIAAVACGTAVVPAQDAAKGETYPAPRFPRFVVNPSAEKLLDAARFAVRQTSGRSPLGNMRSGQTVHVYLDNGQDMEVWAAFQKAWAELGVTAKPIMGWELLDMTKEAYQKRARENMLYGADGWKEVGIFEPAYIKFLPKDMQGVFGNALTTTQILGGLEFPPKPGPLWKYLEKHPEIEHFYAFGGGGNFVRRASGPNKDKFEGNWIYFNKFILMSKMANFPPELWKMLDEQIVRPIPHVSEGTIVDPQGTNLHFLVTPQESRIWEKQSGLTAYSPGHLNMYPPPSRSTWTQGTIAGVANHVGFYPQMTVKIGQHGRVETVEGGGKNGEMFHLILNNPAFKDAQFPSAPAGEKGYWYFTQDGMGTNPKTVRNMDFLVNGAINFPLGPERDRAGIVHFSFASPIGSSVGEVGSQEDVDYAKQRGLPISHSFHIHVYFPTIKWKLRDTGEWITISDKGQLAAFQNPELRALAAKYGDPDTLFSYDWVPEIAGINYEGKYKDFAADPWAWISSTWKLIKSNSYKYYVDDYDMFAKK